MENNNFNNVDNNQQSMYNNNMENMYQNNQMMNNQQPMYNNNVQQGGGISVTALVLGIISAAFPFLGNVSLSGLSFLSGIAAIILGIVGIVKKQKTGFAITGLILGFVPVVLFMIGISLIGALFSAF